MALSVTEVFGKFFLTVANAMNQPTKLERRLRATLFLSALTWLYLISLVMALDYSFDLKIIGSLADLWPWRSANPRSFANQGFFLALFLGAPAFGFWLTIGGRVREQIGEYPSPAWIWEVLSCGLFIMFFVAPLLVSWGGLPWVSLGLQTVLILAAYYWLTRRERSASRNAK